MGTPYVLKSGDNAGKALEVLMFQVDGVGAVRGMSKWTETDRNSGFLRRVKGLLERARTPQVKQACKCGHQAKYISVTIKVDGVGWHDYHCDSCKVLRNSDTSLVPLNYGGLRHFGVKIDKKLFMQRLRSACGLPAKGRLNAQACHDAIYPAPAPKPKPEPRPEPPAKPKQLELL
jgi:hypothetical protein